MYKASVMQVATVGLMAFLPSSAATNTSGFSAFQFPNGAGETVRQRRLYSQHQATKGQISFSGDAVRPFILAAPPTIPYIRRLSAAEDRVFYRAALRSAKVISRGKLVSK